MGLETEIVQETIVEEGGATATTPKDYNPTNPIFEVAKPDTEAPKTEEEKSEPKAEEQPKPEEKKEDPIPKGVQKRMYRAVREKY